MTDKTLEKREDCNGNDKVLAVLPIYEAGLIPAEKVFEILGFMKDELDK